MSRVEYYALAKLRTLPDYARARGQFVGPRLKLLEQAFSQLGIREENVDEMVIGWMASPQGHAMMGGLARGRFDAPAVAEGAGKAKIAATRVGDWTAYCAGEEASCVVVWDDASAAFGPADFLAAMRQAREGRTPTLVANSQFINLLGEMRTEPPFWGIALGEAVPEWFGAWLAGQPGVDWAPLLSDARALSFYMDLDHNVEFHLNLDFSTVEGASRFQRTLETLRQLQQAAWQSQSPGRPNPLNAITLDASDRRVSLKAVANYGSLGTGNPFGIPN